ncbi:MAG: hypothetical protein NC823_02285 [Candidatus Omnitrophica bacterium]|nr:hypothetical protein [Candidatus Omnitrophota bacterium]
MAENQQEDTFPVINKNGQVLSGRRERLSDRRLKIMVDVNGQVELLPVKPLPQDDSWFETVWNKYRTG